MNINPSVEDVVTDEEYALALQLRECCSVHGTERESKIAESAAILLQMGKLYCEKAVKLRGISQKIAFVKSAALICGARARYEIILENKEGDSKCIEEFRNMSTEVLIAGNARDKDAHLMLTSWRLKSLCYLMRDREKRVINENLKVIDSSLSNEELRHKRKVKLKCIRTLVKRNSEGYKEMMKAVSETCVSVLGNPPCEFTLVGLGSLARDEVTLYSDFEHIILMENAALEDKQQYEKSKEYFRWYSVVFQIIIIGLGETFIPTVGVKSLNDLYCNDKSKDWFFDLLTPGGVAFDGRFPHSCKTPLGKQEASKNHKYVIELIQPVDKMLQYLSTQEDLKNGYHLRDVLLRTCYVHGSTEVYKYFVSGCWEVLSKRHRMGAEEDVDKEVVEQSKFVTENLHELYSSTNYDEVTIDMEKIKDFFYRPMNVLAGCFGRIYCFSSGSNFQFFDWFRTEVVKDRMTDALDNYLFTLEYSLAVACEMRIKAYSLRGKQVQKMSPYNLFDLVGKDCAALCLQTIVSTTEMFRVLAKHSAGLDGFAGGLSVVAHDMLSLRHHRTRGWILHLIGYYDEAMEAYNQAESLNGPDKTVIDPDTMASCYTEMALKRPGQDRRELLLKAEKAFESCDDEVRGQLFFVERRSKVLFLLGEFRKAFDLIEKWVRNNWGMAYESNRKHLYIGLYENWMFYARKFFSSDKLLEYLSSDTLQPHDPVSEVAVLRTKGCASLQIGRYDEGLRLLRKSIEICRANTKDLPSEFSLHTAIEIFRAQVLYECKNDAKASLEFIDTIQDTKERFSMKIDPTLLAFYHRLTPDQNMKSRPSRDLLEVKIELHKQNSKENHSMELCRLLAYGFENFKEYANVFRDVPRDIANHPNVLEKLHCSLTEYCIKVAKFKVSDSRIGLDLSSALLCFEEQLLHPCFIGVITDLVAAVAIRLLSYKTMVESIFYNHSSSDLQNMHRLYNGALFRISKLNLKAGADILWKIVNSTIKDCSLKRKASMILAHVTLTSPFPSVIPLLLQQRRNFICRYSSLPRCRLSCAYNEGISKYAGGNWIKSASLFWKQIFFCENRAKQLIKGPIRFLCFTILHAWSCKGYEICFGPKFAAIKPSKCQEPLRAIFGDLLTVLTEDSYSINETLSRIVQQNEQEIN